MTSRDFCYWLQGYFEVKEGETTVPTDKFLTHQQVVMIRNHLAMVFKHEIDPSYKPQKIIDHQQELLSAHQGGIGQGKLDPSGPVYKC